MIWQCNSLGCLRKINVLVGGSGDVLGIRLDASIRRLQRDFLYEIVDLIDRLLYGRFFLVVHGALQNL